MPRNNEESGSGPGIEQEISLAFDLLNQVKIYGELIRRIEATKRPSKKLLAETETQLAVIAMRARTLEPPSEAMEEPGVNADFVSLVRHRITLEAKFTAAKTVAEELEKELKLFDETRFGPAWDEEGVEAIVVDGFKVSARSDRWLFPQEGVSSDEAAAALSAYPDTEKFVKPRYNAQQLRSWLTEQLNELSDERFGKPATKLSAIDRAQLIEDYELPEELAGAMRIDERRTFRTTKK